MPFQQASIWLVGVQQLFENLLILAVLRQAVMAKQQQKLNEEYGLEDDEEDDENIEIKDSAN